jgi:hypothetical protein
MPTKVKLALRSNPLLRVGWRLCLVAVMAGYLLAGSPAAAFDRYTCYMGSTSGGEVFLSCGSSAGNFLYACNYYGCEAPTDSYNQWVADVLCEEVQYNGGCGGYW